MPVCFFRIRKRLALGLLEARSLSANTTRYRFDFFLLSTFVFGSLKIGGKTVDFCRIKSCFYECFSVNIAGDRFDFFVSRGEFLYRAKGLFIRNAIQEFKRNGVSIKGVNIFCTSKVAIQRFELVNRNEGCLCCVQGGRSLPCDTLAQITVWNFFNDRSGEVYQDLLRGLGGELVGFLVCVSLFNSIF